METCENIWKRKISSENEPVIPPQKKAISDLCLNQKTPKLFLEKSLEMFMVWWGTHFSQMNTSAEVSIPHMIPSTIPNRQVYNSCTDSKRNKWNSGNQPPHRSKNYVSAGCKAKSFATFCLNIQSKDKFQLCWRKEVQGMLLNSFRMAFLYQKNACTNFSEAFVAPPLFI